MKRFITYLLLYAYAIMLMKPVVPIIGDLVAHTFYELEHLQVVHQHNGVYHVDEEIQDENKDSDSSGKTIVTNTADASPHELITFSFSLSNCMVKLKHQSTHLLSFPDRYSVPLFLPPKHLA